MHYLDYNEKIQHGTEGFPLGYYLVDEQHPNYSMPFHWHREMEIIQILSGSITLYLDDEILTAEAGDIIFIGEGVIHGGTPLSCVYECVVFDFETLLMHTAACRQYLRPISSHQIRVQNHFPLPASFDHTLHHTVGRLFESLRTPAPGLELTVTGILYEVFGIIIRQNLYEESPGESESMAKKILPLKPVLEYIDQHYDHPVTLNDLSKLSGMTPKYFCHYFRAVIHRTPMDYLNYCRIERACLMLATTSLSVTEIGFLCGFNDSSYFIKTFKKYKAITPKQYSAAI